MLHICARIAAVVGAICVVVGMGHVVAGNYAHGFKGLGIGFMNFITALAAANECKKEVP